MNWHAEWEIKIPPYMNLPRKIANSISGKDTTILQESELLAQYSTLLEKGVCEKPRKVFPKLEPFQSIIMRPWFKVQDDENIVIYQSEICVSGWLNNVHPPYTLSIRLAFRQS